jgi:molybdopterin adenylyltransferase
MDIRVGILTISDRSSQGKRTDASGPSLSESVQKLGWTVQVTGLVPDEIDEIKAILLDWVDRQDVDIVFTTGGTGFSPRDVTPEATMAVIQKMAPGLTEGMRSASLKITPYAMLSRAVAGIRDRTLIINFPGSPKAALENLESIQSILPHAVQLLQNDPGAEAGHSQPVKL